MIKLLKTIKLNTTLSQLKTHCSRTLFHCDMALANKLEAQHVPSKFQFIVEIEGSAEDARIDYAIIDEGKWDLQHTVVPSAFRGKGVGKILAKAAFDHVVKEDLKMKLTCWYLKKYAKENPSQEYLRRIIE